MTNKLPKDVEKKCIESLKDYIFRAAKKDVTINFIAKGMGMQSNTLTNTIKSLKTDNGSSPTLKTWTRMEKYMRKNPM